MEPKKRSSNVVHLNPWYQVRHDIFSYDDINNQDYFLVEPRGNGSVMIVAVQSGKILVIEQYRYPVGGMEIELCAGMLEKNESVIDGATRELAEEAGLHAKKLTLIGDLNLSSSLSSWKVHVVVAADFTPAATTIKDPSEKELHAKWISLEDWETAIRSNKVGDSLSIAAWKLYESQYDLYETR